MLGVVLHIDRYAVSYFLLCQYDKPSILNKFLCLLNALSLSAEVEINHAFFMGSKSKNFALDVG
jgi:hypothetical protein